MNIWILNHYATTPDEPTTRSYDIGKQLVKDGHSVTIFASSFSHYKFTEKVLRPGAGTTVEEKNPEQLAEAIGSLLVDAGLRRRAGVEGYWRVKEEFNTSANVGRLIAAMKEKN